MTKKKLVGPTTETVALDKLHLCLYALLGLDPIQVNIFAYNWLVGSSDRASN